MSETVDFNGLKIRPLELVKPRWRRVESWWPKSWTRIEFQVANVWTSADQIEAWIETNLPDGGNYGIIIINDPDQKEASGWDNKYNAAVGFALENDALMFKLLDGHIEYCNINAF